MILGDTKRFSFEALSVWVLALTTPLALVFFIPSETIPMVSTKVFVLVLGSALAFALFAVARLMKGSMQMPPLLLAGALWLIPFAYALSTLFSGVPFSTALFGFELETDTLGFVFLLSSLTTLSALIVRTAKNYKLFYVLGFVALVVTLLAQTVFVTLGVLGTGISSVTNIVGSFTDLGMVVGLGVVLILMTLRTFSFRPLIRAVLFVALVVAILLLIVANSNIIWILVAFVAGALFVEKVMTHTSRHETPQQIMGGQNASYHSEKHSSGHRLLIPLVCILVALFFVFLDDSETSASGLANRAASLVGISVIDVRPSWQSTFLVGSHTLASSPLFGSGPTTFGQEWLKFKDRSLNDTLFWGVDFNAGIGYIPTSFITTGVVGALAWLFFLGLFLLTGFRALMFRLPEDTFIRFVSLSSFVGAGYVFLLAFLATPGPVVLASGFAMCGVFMSSLRHGKGQQEQTVSFSQSPRVGFALVFILTLLLLGALATVYRVAERYVSQIAYVDASVALSTGDIERAQMKVEQSVALAPTDRAYRLGSAIGIERMRRIANDSSIPVASAQEQFQTALSNSIASGAEATRLGVNNYQNWMVLGNVYQSVATLRVEGAYEGAKEAYAKATALNPTSPVLPYTLAQLELVEENLLSAEEYALAAVNLKRDYIPAILLLAQLEIRLGKASEALQAAEAAAYFAPNDPAVLLQVGLLRSGTGDADGSIKALSRAVELNPQFANARFFLAAMHARKGELVLAIEQLKLIASFSTDNASAIAADLSELESGRNPFTDGRLRSLGVPQPPVSEPQETTVE